MSLFRRGSAGGTGGRKRTPRRLPPLDRVAVFGEDAELVRLVAARDEGVGMLERAATDEERLKGLLLFTNMSTACVDRMNVLVPRLSEMSKYDPSRDAAADWAKASIDTMRDIEEWAAEQKELVARLGPMTQRVLCEVQDFADDLLESEAVPAPTELDALPIPQGLEAFNEPAFVRLVEAHNDGVRMLQRAADQEQRLTGLLLAAGAGDKLPDSLGRLVERLTGMHESGNPRFQEHKDYLSQLTAQLETNIKYVDVAQDSGEEIDDDVADRAVAVARARLDEAESATGGASATRETTAAEETDATKVCPDCAESVKAAARVCRYCGYRFEPT